MILESLVMDATLMTNYYIHVIEHFFIAQNEQIRYTLHFIAYASNTKTKQNKINSVSSLDSVKTDLLSLKLIVTKFACWCICCRLFSKEIASF